MDAFVYGDFVPGYVRSWPGYVSIEDYVSRKIAIEEAALEKGIEKACGIREHGR